MTEPDRPAVDGFDSFAGYFSAQAAWLKETDRRFSYRWLASRLGLKSHTLLLRFAKGTQLPTPEMLGRIVDVFKLTVEEGVYLRALVGLAGAKTAEERDFFQQKTDGIKRPDVPRRRLELDSFDLISQWYHAALVELAGTAGFSDDPEKLAARLRGDVTPDDIAAALARLERLGLLTRDHAGRLTRAPGAFGTVHNVPSTAIRKFHGDMLDRAREALTDVPTAERLFFGQTLAFDRTRMIEAQSLIVEFRARFHKLMEGGNADGVYHLAVQFLPLTR